MADSVNALLSELDSASHSGVAADTILSRLRLADDSVGIRESWKYTRLQKFLEPTTAADVCAPVIRGLDQPGVSSYRASEQSSNLTAPGDAASAEKFPLADLALLLTGDCLFIELAADSATRLDMDFIDGISIPVHIRVGTHARLSIIESSSATNFANQTLYLELEEHARVQHARCAFESDCCHWSFTQVLQAAGSDYQLQQYLGGGQPRRHETQIILQGRDATAALTGAYRILAGTHLDQQITVEHRAGATVSQQKFHGLGAGKGTAVFNGRIHIHPGAPGSDARLSNRNLALHPDAIINTKPELEIYTDDVKCAHGATVGAISDDSLFYLRSRGISTTDARNLLCRAFVRECIEGPMAAQASIGLLDETAEAAFVEPA